MDAHNDNDPSEIPIPRARRTPRRRWKRAGPWAIAFAAHAVLAALFLMAIAQRETPQPAPEAIVVTLVERPSPDLAALAPEFDAAGLDAGQTDGAPESEPDAPAALPRDFAIDVTPRPGTATLVLPQVPRFSDSAPAAAPPSDDVRLTLAAAQVCRAFEPPPEQLRDGCPPVRDRSAEIQLAGLEPTDFLDPALAPPEPPPPGTAEFDVGPLAVSLTLFGSGPTPYRLTIKPRAPREKSVEDPQFQPVAAV